MEYGIKDVIGPACGCCGHPDSCNRGAEPYGDTELPVGCSGAFVGRNGSCKERKEKIETKA